jgi:hypothetical protein
LPSLQRQPLFEEELLPGGRYSRNENNVVEPQLNFFQTPLGPYGGGGSRPSRHGGSSSLQQQQQQPLMPSGGMMSSSSSKELTIRPSQEEMMMTVAPPPPLRSRWGESAAHQAEYRKRYDQLRADGEPLPLLTEDTPFIEIRFHVDRCSKLKNTTTWIAQKKSRWILPAVVIELLLKAFPLFGMSGAGLKADVKAALDDPAVNDVLERQFNQLIKPQIDCSNTPIIMAIMTVAVERLINNWANRGTTFTTGPNGEQVKVPDVSGGTAGIVTQWFGRLMGLFQKKQQQPTQPLQPQQPQQQMQQPQQMQQQQQYQYQTPTTNATTPIISSAPSKSIPGASTDISHLKLLKTPPYWRVSEPPQQQRQPTRPPPGSGPTTRSSNPPVLPLLRTQPSQQQPRAPVKPQPPATSEQPSSLVSSVTRPPQQMPLVSSATQPELPKTPTNAKGSTTTTPSVPSPVGPRKPGIPPPPPVGDDED